MCELNDETSIPQDHKEFSGEPEKGYEDFDVVESLESLSITVEELDFIRAAILEEDKPEYEFFFEYFEERGGGDHLAKIDAGIEYYNIDWDELKHKLARELKRWLGKEAAIKLVELKVA